MKRTIFILTILTGIITSFQPIKNQFSSNERELHSGIRKANMDTSVKPGDDFMEYANGGWLKRTKIPDDKYVYGLGIDWMDTVDNNVKNIIDLCATGNFKKGTDAQKIGDLYKSYMDVDRRNNLGVQPIAQEFQKIDDLKGYDNLADYFGYALKFGYTAPFIIEVWPDLKNPTVYSATISQSGLGLPDREYYLNDTKDFSDIRIKYLAHIEKMFDLAGLKNGKTAANTIWDLETQLARQQVSKEKTRDAVSMYHMVSTDSLSALMPDFNWKAYLKSARLQDQKNLIVYGWEYEKGLNKVIKSISLDKWKTYLKWGVLNSRTNSLTEALETQNFEFYNKVLRGVPKQSPLWQRGGILVNKLEGEMVGKIYVQKFFPPQAKAKAETMVKNLLRAYKESINSLNWMGENTRAKALEKLNKIVPKIGYPDKWRNYDALKIDKDDLFGNVQRSALFEYSRNLKNLGQPVDRKEWDIYMSPQTVNAFYDPSKNEIFFPAAILQPFFEMDAEDAFIYGSVGSMMGHEIGHAFDDQGSAFDGDGKLQNWWTDTDREAFKTRTNALVTQYNGFEVLPLLFVNGAFTLGENIGDLSGLTITNKAYKISLNGKESPKIDGFTAEQRLFIGFAQMWCFKSRDAVMRQRINADPHSPEKFRVNGVVRNIPDFYTAFNVQPGDSLYLAPKDRVKIW